MKPKDFIGVKASYDKDGQIIWGENNKGELQMLLNVRGWGAIQNLFKNQEIAAKFQDEFGEWITEAINEKLKKENNYIIENSGTDNEKHFEKCPECGAKMKSKNSGVVCSKCDYWFCF